MVGFQTVTGGRQGLLGNGAETYEGVGKEGLSGARVLSAQQSFTLRDAGGNMWDDYAWIGLLP